MKENKLWVSENRSPTERRQCKLVSKLKRLLFEHDKQKPKNVNVNYKWCHVRARNGKILTPEDIGQVSATVKEHMAQIEANMEQGQFGQQGSRERAGPTVRGHVVTNNAQSIQGKERFDDFIIKFDTFEFDLFLLHETW